MTFLLTVIPSKEMRGRTRQRKKSSTSAGIEAAVKFKPAYLGCQFHQRIEFLFYFKI